MASIITLPEDVLLEIFKFHVWRNMDTPKRLLLICRRWHTVAANSPSLWGRILYDTNSTPISQAQTSLRNGEIFCKTPEELEQAIRRTKNCAFEVEIHSNGEEAAWSGAQSSNVSKRCRSLKIVAWMPSLSILSLFQDLPELQELEIGIPSRTKWSLIDEKQKVKSLLDTVERTSLHLWKLTLRMDRSPGYPLAKYPRLIARVKSFHIIPGGLSSWHASDWAPIFGGFTALDELKISHRGWWRSIRSIPLSNPLHQLHLDQIHPTGLPAAIYQDLTSLRIDNGDIPFNEEYSLQLPQLTSLVLSNSWTATYRIEAPALQTLVLRGTDERPSYAISKLRYTSLRPKRLDMDMAMDEDQLRILLRDVWADLEELKLVYLHPGKNYHTLLHIALMGTAKRPPACANLRSFRIIAPVPSTKKSMVQSEERLQKLVDARKNGMGLTFALYGWYILRNPKRDRLEGPRSSEDWVDESPIRWVVKS